MSEPLIEARKARPGREAFYFARPQGRDSGRVEKRFTSRFRSQFLKGLRRASRPGRAQSRLCGEGCCWSVGISTVRSSANNAETRERGAGCFGEDGR